MAVTPKAQLVLVGALLADDPRSTTVAAALASAGLPVTRQVSVEDDAAALEEALAADMTLTVIFTGPGTIPSDLVNRAVARVAGSGLALDARMAAALEERAQRTGQPLSRRAARLALLPQGATVWVASGREPVWMVERDAGAFVVLGGETDVEPALAEHVLPWIAARLDGGGTLQRVLRTAGVSVIELEERLARWLLRPLREGAVKVSLVVPAEGEVWVRLRAPGGAATALAAAESELTGALGRDCFGRDGESLESVVGRLLLARGLTVSLAESCTGGLLGHRLTGVAGSSAYFERGVVVYSNRAKQELLGVPEPILAAHGAVSGPCAEAMARGVARASGSACALAVTGIAGPSGGTPTKPVGTVFIGLAVGDDVVSRHFVFPGSRSAVKWQSAQMALDMLRRRLEEGSA